jgi:hypothetical protein
MEIEGLGNYSFNIGNSNTGKNQNASNLDDCSSCATPLENGGAEYPAGAANRPFDNRASYIPGFGWKTTRNPAFVQVNNGRLGQYIQPHEGNQYIEINGSQFCAVYQELCLRPGSTITWSIWHSCQFGTGVAHVMIGAKLQALLYSKY